MKDPLVSIICICFNQGKYVEESINSVLNQTYKNTELIVVDNGSNDDSKDVIKRIINGNDAIHFIDNNTNLGLNTAFNKAWSCASGLFVIDLAADDVLLPERIRVGVEKMTRMGAAYGVHFSDAIIIDSIGIIIGEHNTNSYFDSKDVPEGDIYADLLCKYFICPPTMMYSREVMEFLGGYDENLAYEDFDFWVRSSRKFKYCYTHEQLVKRRNLKTSYANSQYSCKSNMPASTLQVCRKALNLSTSIAEMDALKKRIKYEGRQCLLAGQLKVLVGYIYLFFSANIKLNLLKS